MTSKVTTIPEAIGKYLADGQTIMVGGFGRGGTPFSLLDYLAENCPEWSDLTVMKNDANEPGIGVDKLFQRGMVKTFVSTHIGLNPEFIQQMNKGEIATTIIPQGIFAEKIRAGGAGIAAFLHDIGVGTEVEDQKEKVQFEGKEYLLEPALRGDVALVCCDRVDEIGNCWWRGSNRNMCTVMATACNHVIVEAQEVVPIGELSPENIHIPGVFIDAVVPAAPRKHVAGGQ